MANTNPYNLSRKDFKAKKRTELAAARKKAQEEKEKRQKEREQRKKDLSTQTENVQNNTEQPKGIAKFTPLILNKGSYIVMTMVPTLTSMVKETFGDDFDSAKEDLGNLVCPPQKEVQEMILKLNGVIDDLNQISDFITKITDISTSVSAGLVITQQVSNILKYSIPIVSSASKSIPLIPGIVVSALDDLDWINNNLLYKNDGTPKIPGINAGVNGISASTAIVSITINRVVPVIESLIKVIEKCLGPIDSGGDTPEEYTLNSLNPNVKKLAELGTSNFETKDPLTYNGFIIKVETVPFTPTVNRYQAVGYNTYGIPMIKGELSFTPNALVLTNELKFVIDRDNLKAY